MAVIEVRNITKKYGRGDAEVLALGDVSFCLEQGDFCIITGASGSGKSTFLEVCAGLIPPTFGTVKYEGEDIAGFNDEERAKYRSRHIGFVFQDFRLMDNLTLRENISLPALIVKESDFYKRLCDIADKVGLGGRLDHFPDEVSGGEKQRCAIARSIINGPKILFADEPTGNLDSGTSVEILDIMLDINKSGTSVMLVTHDMSILDYVSDRAERFSWFVMENGKLRRQK